jgi:hypothetical protein
MIFPIRKMPENRKDLSQALEEVETHYRHRPVKGILGKGNSLEIRRRWRVQGLIQSRG